MDFITGLPPIRGKLVKMVVIDRISKYAHFITLSSKLFAITVAQTFISEICRLYRIPKTIVSYRDSIFMSTFWQELFRLSGTILCRNSAYHPQTDG